MLHFTKLDLISKVESITNIILSFCRRGIDGGHPAGVCQSHGRIFEWSRYFDALKILEPAVNPLPASKDQWQKNA